MLVGKSGQNTCILSRVTTTRFSHLPVLWILTKWFQMTRLETRTKESNAYASFWVIKPDKLNESNKVGICYECTIDRSGFFNDGSE